MSRENVDVVRSLYVAYNGVARGDDVASYVREHYDAECEYQPVEETGTIRGHEALIRWIERWLEAWDEAWDEIDGITEVGERVVARIRAHGRGRTSGVEISQCVYNVFDLRDGK